MATLPSATTRLSTQGGTAPVSTDLLAVWAPVSLHADNVPRLYTSVSEMLAEHGNGEHIDFASMYMAEADLPILLVPMPISTAGAIKRQSTVHSGTSQVTATVGAAGALMEVDAIVMVTSGGTIGTDQILLSLSVDGGKTFLPIRLGTSTSYFVYPGAVTLTFGPGTLVTNDTIIEFKTSAPAFDSAAVTAGLNALVAQQKLTRSWLFIGDVSTTVLGQAIANAAATYETSADRFVDVMFQARDRKSVEATQFRTAMSGGPGVTFAEVGATGDTITRAAGSFVTDGFFANDFIRVTGSASNNVSGKITAVTATILTLDTADLSAEVAPPGLVRITAEPTFTFAAATDTITRNRGSWIAEGFAVGDTITVTGATAPANNGTHIITVLTATVMTLGASTLVDETAGSCTIGITSTESSPAWRNSIDSTFAVIDAAPRVNIVAGRGTKLSTFTNYSRRLPWSWADMIRSFQHDVHITTWWKALGPMPQWNIDGEHDERVDGGLLAARFTCARTWGNGPQGAFTANSITRATDGNVLVLANNMRVANVAQTVCQRTTEEFVGQTVVLNPPDQDGKRTATRASLGELEAKVNRELQRNLLANLQGEGPRASSARWIAAQDDDLGVPGATLHGTLELGLNGTIVHIATIVEVN